MSAWGRGFLTGAAAALLLLAFVSGATRFDAFVRVAAEDRFVLDTRVDEPVLSRVINVPVATLGEASFTKRSWLLFTSYEFALQLRPEVAPGPGRAIQDLQVSVRLPGSVTFTNATRISAGAAVWETLPSEPLVVRTRAVHWVRVLLVVLLAAVGVAAARRR